MDQTTPSAAVFVGIDVAKKQLDVHIRLAEPPSPSAATGLGWTRWFSGCRRCRLI